MNLRGLSWKKRTGLALGTSVVLLVGAVGVAYAMTSIPTPNAIATAQATRLLYADGTEIGRVGTNRQIVSLSKISRAAQHAVLAAEDRGFYDESGISPRGILRALFTNVRGGGVAQGGSTITQQYAKNAFLTQQRTYTRKIKEALIAVKMSRTFSKDTILEDYLNTIYFGRGAYGIEAAAHTFFTTSAAQLTAAQAAVLASSVRSPAGYDPARHPDRAKERWAYVLDGMVKMRWLTSAERTAATYPAVRPISAKSFPGPLDAIREQVVAELEHHGFSEDRINAGGLTVLTTIERTPQKAATAAVESAVPAPTGKHPPVAALVAVQPGTGRVIAYYGARQPGGFDYASDGLGVQPGSSMKPYVLAAALESGASLDTRYDASTPQSICGSEIHNDHGDPPLGRTDLVTGLQYSVNTVYYRLACDTGAQKVADLAHAAGIPARDPLADAVSHRPTAQIALGSGGYEIHVIDQAVGYATFAAQGIAAAPYFVQKVTLDNRVVYTAKPRPHRAFSAAVAANTTVAMQKVVEAGTGTRAQLTGRPAAGKTGTTGNNANAWFAGFTPQLSTAVWVGREGGTPLKGVLGSTNGVYGGTIPAGIFHAFMDAALEGKPALPFPPRVDTGTAVTQVLSHGSGPAPTPSASGPVVSTQAPVANTAVVDPGQAAPPVEVAATSTPVATSSPAPPPPSDPPPPSAPPPSEPPPSPAPSP